MTVSTDHTSGSSFDQTADFVVQPLAVGEAESLPTIQPNLEVEAPSDEFSQEPLPSPNEQPLAIEAIEFRVIRPGAPLRRLRLTGNRYTFGSAEGCSIRLTDHALRPMHAVLIRDQTRILVRAYSVPIEVNGTRKTETTLEVGDILRLGEYQFELLETSFRSPLDSDPAFRTAPTSVFDVPVKPVEPRRGLELPASDDVIWRDRLRREIDQWRDRQVECDRRENRIDERESELRNRESELWTRAENLYRRESRLQAQESSAMQLYDDYSQRQQELIRLREAAQSQQEEFHQREAEFRKQEFQYRRQLQEATEQLTQSQQQAESATQAVLRMREQFESLNEQIEQLSGQQQGIESQELRQREEHEQLRHQLEIARDQAIDAQAESEARRREAEARIEEMAAQIEQLQSGNVDFEAQREQLAASEQVATDLQQQVEELQRSVAEASEESARLRADYEGACVSVRQLESLVEQSKTRGDSDRQSWESEAEELRAAVDQLSIDLANANSELSDIRAANETMSARLEEVQKERDDAIDAVDARPTPHEFQSLREELDTANQQLADMRSEYEETLARLAEAESNQHAESVSEPLSLFSETDASEVMAEDTPQESILEEESNVDEPDDNPWPTYHAENEPASEVEPTIDDDPVESDVPLKPEARHEPGEEPSDENEQLDPGPESIVIDDIQESVWQQENDSNDFAAETDSPSLWQQEQTDEPAIADESTPTNESTSWQASESFDQSDDEANVTANYEPEVAATDEIAATSNWDSSPSWDREDVSAPAWQSESTDANEDAEPTMSFSDNNWSESSHIENETSSSVWNEEPQLEEAPSEDEIVQGSLASQLIQDLQNDPAPMEEDHEAPSGTFLMSEEDNCSSASSPESTEAAWNEDTSNTSSWDREFPEEKSSSEWSNSDDGYRIENVQPEEIEEVEQIESTYNLESASEEHEPVDDYVEAADQDSSDENETVETTSEEDDSIEAYMNRLLNRVQPGDEPKEDPTPVSVTSTALETEQLSESVETATEAPIDPDAPLIPRSQAPERNSDLNAMRELANASARSAISRSVRIQNRNIQIQGSINFACAAGVLACGAACYMLLEGFLCILAVAMTLVIAVICIREGLAQFAEAKRRLAAAESGKLDEDADFENEVPAATEDQAPDSIAVGSDE